MTGSGRARPTNHVVAGLGVIRRRPEQVDPDSPTVVLVHGAMDRAASFGRVLRRLDGIDVCAYDRRGYATSAEAGVAATMDEQAADLLAVCDWTGAKAVVVVGHSFGGTVALRLASTDPTGLVGLGAFESPVPTLANYRSDGVDLALGAAELGGPAAAAEAFYTLMVGEAVWKRLRPADRAARLAEGPQLLAELADLRRPASVPDLASVVLPTLVGAGGSSSPSWRASAKELSDRLPSATYVEIPAAGHGAHLSHPDEFARYVRSCAGIDDPTDPA